MWSFRVLLFWGCCITNTWEITTIEQKTGDVNECADTTTCPAFATCTNTVGSYYCTCKRGFQSSNGQGQFRGPGVECRDVDECTQSPPRCGLNSACSNMLGRYRCRCLPGFSSPTGDDWVLGKPGTFSCTDIDECLSGPCPEHAHCANSAGSYSCHCQAGFVSNGSTCEDVNECADTTTCPAFATCTNTAGSYYCTCKRGFQSSNGQGQFRGPGVECRDIDECKQSPPRCGPNSACSNVLGRYRCRCLPGFTSPTGDDWVPRKPGTFSCTDIDECLSGPCPEHAHCANSAGSYSCHCQAGFVSNGSTCEDVDECTESCPSNSICTNIPGSHFCTCRPGFAPSSGGQDFRAPGVECWDVDECSRDPSPCGPNAVCTNRPGSYSCSCEAGFRPHPEGSWTQGNFSCKRVPFKCKEDLIPHSEWVQQCQAGAAGQFEHAQASFCELMNSTVRVLDATCENRSATVSLQSAAESFASVLDQKSTWTAFSREEASALATVVLGSVESSVLAALLKPSLNSSQTVQTEHLDIESKVINDDCLEENVSFHLKAKGNEMKIGCSVIQESESTGTIGVAFVSFANMESVLDQRFFQDSQNPWANSKWKLKMNSRVVSGVMTGERKDGFSDSVVYTLENLQPKQKSERPICVSWSTEVGDGRWTQAGCEVLGASEMHTVCGCNRLANLAIIMASEQLTMDFSLFVISHVGLVISLVCLLLAIATFLLCRTIRSHTTTLHLHLCVCLFLAKLLFLTGIDKTDHQMGCAIIAGCLHYLFLACFFWMLLEAVVLFLMVRNLKVVNYFSSRSISMLRLCAIGYGLPGLVVAISASLQPQGYGTPNRCWLNTARGFVWSFLGPVCAIIKINSVLLIRTLCILRLKLSSVNAEVSTLKDTRLLTFKAFAQLFILGSSWVLGIFQIGPMASVMAYLFTTINSLQGAFIFLIHCVLSRQVREEYRRWLTRRTTPSSQAKTSGILLSSMPSTSKSAPKTSLLRVRTTDPHQHQPRA